MSNSKKQSMTYQISYRPITNNDIPFLRNLYSLSRYKELTVTGWNGNEINTFLFSQFSLQHQQYMDNYKNANFDIIVLEKNKDIGRLYVDRRIKEIRVIDIIILPSYQKKGIGSQILTSLIEEAEKKKVIIGLHVEQNNPAIKLYKKFGFINLKNKGIYIYMIRKPLK